MTIYILKIQGTKKIPDYIQIRDEDFTLVAYFRINNPRRALSRCNLLDQQEQILEIANKLPYGKIHKLEV
ncbi:MAG: fructose-6-phosphate aldolase [Bacteroidetes bacterium]|nr:fructose-6-phosphate aldolase [Bacteroidota bacterium]